MIFSRAMYSWMTKQFVTINGVMRKPLLYVGELKFIFVDLQALPRVKIENRSFAIKQWLLFHMRMTNYSSESEIQQMVLKYLRGVPS